MHKDVYELDLLYLEFKVEESDLELRREKKNYRGKLESGNDKMELVRPETGPLALCAGPVERPAHAAPDGVNALAPWLTGIGSLLLTVASCWKTVPHNLIS